VTGIVLYRLQRALGTEPLFRVPRSAVPRGDATQAGAPTDARALAER